MKKTLYLCGAGNHEGIRLALVVNRAQKRWERVVLLDDDPSKHGRLVLGVEIVGPFAELERANRDSDEIANMVTRTTVKRQAAWVKLQAYGLRFAELVDPNVDVSEVELNGAVTIYQNTTFCASAYVDEESVVLTGAIVGHGCRVGRCCVIAPGAVVNARVDLGDGVYVGSNASILPDLKVGAWATIGANSAVIQNVSPGATVMGVPAQVLIPGSEDRDHASAPAPGDASKVAQGSLNAPMAEPEPSEDSSSALSRLRIAQQEFINSRKSGG